MMKSVMKKTILAAAIALGTVSSGAMASQVFTVDTGTLNAPHAALVFTADTISGSYSEILTVTGANTFVTSISWQGTAFSSGGVPITHTGLGDNWGLYATYQGSGTFAPDGSGDTIFSTTAGGSLNMYVDPMDDTILNKPSSGFAPWTTTNSSDDYLVATGTPLAGSHTGILDPNLSTCNGGSNDNCGSFGTSSTFALTNAGKGFFTLPNPFYNMSFQSGILDNFVLSESGPVPIEGTLSVTFGTAVPEPSDIALMGLGLLVLGLTMRGRKNV
jgi:hypothetical protein